MKMTAKTNQVRPVRKRSRSYRPRIHSFNLQRHGLATKGAPIPDPDPPSSPLSGSRSGSDTSTVPPLSSQDNLLQVQAPSASSTYLTPCRILQVSDQLARQSSQQLITLTRANTKKNSGPRPFAMAFNRVMRRIRVPSPGLSSSSGHLYSSPMNSSSALPSTISALSSASSAFAASCSRTSISGLSGIAAIPGRVLGRKSRSKSVSFSETVTILSECQQGDKWLDVAETKPLCATATSSTSDNDIKNGNTLKFAPKEDRARSTTTRRRMGTFKGAGRRSSLAEFPPLRIRSDTTVNVINAKNNAIMANIDLDLDGPPSLGELRTARFPRGSFQEMYFSDSSSSHSDHDDDVGNDSERDVDMVKEKTGSSCTGTGSSEGSFIVESDSDREGSDVECEEEESRCSRRGIVSNRSARNLAYLYTTTALHSRPKYGELRVTKD